MDGGNSAGNLLVVSGPHRAHRVAGGNNPSASCRSRRALAGCEPRHRRRRMRRGPTGRLPPAGCGGSARRFGCLRPVRAATRISAAGGSSGAAALTNASNPPLTVDEITPVAMGSRASTPVMRVNDPPSVTRSCPCSTTLIWPPSLSANPWAMSPGDASRRATNGAPPAAQTTASTVPVCSYMAMMECSSRMSTAS